MRKLFVTTMLAATLAASPALAQDTGRGEGEVRRIDKENGKVTLRHGPLEGLDMPAMTMVFRARDPALLDRLKVGDRIRFRAAKENGTFVLTGIE